MKTIFNRLGQLAKPKTYGGLPIKKMSEWDWGEWSSDVKSLKNYTCSSRVDQLAEPKATHEKYTGNRSAHCFISKGAKNAEVRLSLGKFECFCGSAIKVFTIRTIRHFSAVRILLYLGNNENISLPFGRVI